ncbi:MAG: sugar ABC transporter ATP-binding protein [Betaproteobacteria bacterium]|nr:sugar ABC transporter ATP-binding protein [Betaproteobacteria bacterium]
MTKRYGTHTALDGVSVDFHPGCVHVLFGENGAGKSTFITMLAGGNPATAGEIEFGSFLGVFDSVVQARAHGIRAVFQEFSLVPQLTVAENIVLGEEPRNGLGILDLRAARVAAQALIESLGFDLAVDARVADLPRGKQQMVEICKALRSRPKVLILDEPTASLSEHDAQSLFKLVRKLREEGTAILYITHRIHEITLLADVVTVLRDGKLIATVGADTPHDRLIELMTGRTMSNLFPQSKAKIGLARLELRNLTLAVRPGAVRVKRVNLVARAGEIVGVAGLVGCGKSELGQACFGLWSVKQGEILLDGEPFAPKHPADAIKRGFWYSPADRKNDGLMLGRSAGENIVLSGSMWGEMMGRWLRPRHERRVLTKLAGRVAFSASRMSEPVSNFSGGNQQKVMLAKGLAQDIGVYVFDEPTVGVDVGARPAIYQHLVELAESGAAIVLVSSDLPELLGICNRLLVMHDGEIVAEFDRAEFDEQRILEKFF